MTKKFSKFIIIASPRTGSTLLCSLLNSHNRITCHSEIFHPAKLERAFELEDSVVIKKLLKIRDQQPEVFLDRLWKYNVKNDAVGFKIFPGHNDYILNSLINNKTIKKIILKRNNLLRVYVSLEIARKTGDYDLDEGISPKLEKIEVQINEFEEYVKKQMNEQHIVMKELGKEDIDFITLEYTSLNLHETHNKLLEYLEIPQKSNLFSNKPRQNPFLLKEIIHNYNEFTKACSGKDIEKYLVDE